MSSGHAFLHAFAQALAAIPLYTPGHPATRRSIDQLWQVTGELLQTDPHPVFLFLGTAPVYAGRALHELHDWQHSGRLSAIGVQRLEFDATLTLASLTRLVEHLSARLSSGQPAGEGGAIPGVVFGEVALHEQVDVSTLGASAAMGGVEADVSLDLADELDAMRFIQAEAARGVVARAETDAVVRILAALVDRHRAPPAARAASPDRFWAAHPVNTALLAMTAARVAGLDAVGRHRIGVVALLHDIGMALLPSGLADQESFTDAERLQFEAHVATGAALLLSVPGASLELAAVVAFEHHLRPDGNGYPARRFAIESHWASRLVSCCAVFAGLRLLHPLRAEWPAERALRYIEAAAGTEFDPAIVALVSATVRAT